MNTEEVLMYADLTHVLCPEQRDLLEEAVCLLNSEIRHGVDGWSLAAAHWNEANGTNVMLYEREVCVDGETTISRAARIVPQPHAEGHIGWTRSRAALVSTLPL